MVCGSSGLCDYESQLLHPMITVTRPYNRCEGDYVSGNGDGEYGCVDRTEPPDFLRREKFPATVEAAPAPSARSRCTPKPEYDAWLQRQLAQAPPLSDERWHQVAQIIASTAPRHGLEKNDRPSHQQA